MKKTKTDKPQRRYPEVDPTGQPWQFPATKPPIETDVGSWQWRTASPVYRRKIKRAVQAVVNYRMYCGKDARMTRQDVDACHRLLDTLTFDAARRTRRDGSSGVIKDALMGDGQGDGVTT